jgi:hypothetical protein
MGMRMRAWCVIFVALLAGCDRESAAPTPAAKKAKELVVEVRGVTPLLPDRRTHVAPTGTGQVFWVQEAADAGGRETVFTLGDGGLATATKFSNASVLAALKEQGGRGGIQSLAATSEGEIFYYFAGQTKRKLLVALGAFSPASGETRVIADAAALREASGMGNTLALARGSVLRSASAGGGRTWLWLRHDHGFVVLALEAGGSLRRAFDRLRLPQGEALELVSPGEDLVADGDGLVYLERGRGRLWRIGGGGEASVLADVSELPRGTTAPSPDGGGGGGGGGGLAMFAPEGPPFVEPPDNPLFPPKPVADFPALVRYTGARRTILPRGVFDAPSRLNVRALAFGQLVRDRSSWLGYDAQTGELLRVRVGER